MIVSVSIRPSASIASCSFQRPRSAPRRSAARSCSSPRSSALLVELIDDGPVAAERRDLGDPRAHRPGADDADPLGHSADEGGTIALMPVASRPMISLWIWEVPS